MSDDEKESSVTEGEKFVEAIENDPSAKRISDLATSPPAKDISAIKAASDLLDAEALEREEAGQKVDAGDHA